MKTQTPFGATIAACATFCVLGFAQNVNASPHYVDLNSTNPVSPFLSWNTAATNMQDAVDVATNGTTVLVTNGTYYVSTEITVASGITIQSVNGWTNTIVDAQESGRCFYLDDAGAILDGFTITRGYASGSGGGVYCNGGTVRNCCIHSNTATGGSYGDRRGGGVYCTGGTISHCVVSNNLALGLGYSGGGVYITSGATLQHCTISANEVYGGTSGSSGSPVTGGGVYCTGSTITNCTISGNTARGANSGQSASGGGVYMSGNAVVASCIVMANEALRSSGGAGQTGDGGGITCAGGVVRDCLIQGNLASSGSGGGVSGGDANGTATPDMGCYEYLNAAADSDGDGLNDGSEVNTYGTDPTDTNSDDDPHTDYEEYIADTDGADGNDYFRILSIAVASPVTVYFNSSSNRLYTMSGCSNLVDGAWTEVPGAGPRLGTGGMDSMVDTNEPPRGPFYRLAVQSPG